MHFLPLLRKPLKSDEIIEILEDWAVEVIYSFDRDHENLPDQYVAPARQEGVQMIFDENQRLATAFIYVVPSEDFQAANLSDSDVTIFRSKNDVSAYAEANSIKVTEGNAELFGIERDWIRLDFDDHSIHYEFRNGALGLITVSTTNNQAEPQRGANLASLGGSR